MKILVKEKLSPHKYKTPEGYLVCVDAILARIGKQRYTRDEVYNDGDQSEIDVDRKPEQVFSPEAMASFENKPVTIEHPDDNVTPENYRDLAVGFVRDVHRGMYQDSPVMMGTIVLTDSEAIKDVMDGDEIYLSCGYDCDVTEGEHPEQMNIRGNHVALCEVPRAGITRIQDSLKKKKGVDLDDVFLKDKTISELAASLQGNDDKKILERMRRECKECDCPLCTKIRKICKTQLRLLGRDASTVSDEAFDKLQKLSREMEEYHQEEVKMHDDSAHDGDFTVSFKSNPDTMNKVQNVLKQTNAMHTEREENGNMTYVVAENGDTFGKFKSALESTPGVSLNKIKDSFDGKMIAIISNVRHISPAVNAQIKKIATQHGCSFRREKSRIILTQKNGGDISAAVAGINSELADIVASISFED